MDILEQLEQKPKSAGPWRKIKTDNGIRWSGLRTMWHGEPWSLCAWRLRHLKRPAAAKKAKPIQGRIKGCLHAGVAQQHLSMDAMLAVGFGSVDVSVGKVTLWGGDDPTITVRRVEKLAATRPELDWRIRYNGPLSGTSYQRTGPSTWVLVSQDQGFA